MDTTAKQIFAALDATHPTANATAAALGISKQAYSIARQRLSLSDDLCIRACLILHLDAALTLALLHLDAANTPATIAAWEDICNRLTRKPQTTENSTPNDQTTRSQQTNTTEHNPAQNTNYAGFGNAKNSGFCLNDIDNNAGPDTIRPADTMHSNATNTHHLPLSDKLNSAQQLVKWMLCVPKLSPVSKRFKYYADNWHVLDKIRRFTSSGEFDTLTKDCPAFSAEELRAALDYLSNSDTAEKPRNTTELQNDNQAVFVQTLLPAALAL